MISTTPVPPRPASRPAALREPVKWLHREALESFTHRLLVANRLDARALRLATAPGLQEHRYSLDEHVTFIEGLAGRPAGHYDRLHALTQPDPTLTYPKRFLCRLCASGEHVEQIPHDRGNWCLRHPGQMVWVGAGTTPESQVILSFDRDLAKAERRFRRLVAAGRVDARLHARVWEMIRDNAWLTRPDGWKPALVALPDDREVRGRAALYPEVVAVLKMLSDPDNVERWRRQGPEELRNDIVTTLPLMPGPVDVLVERIVLWLRRLRREIRPTRIDPLNVPLDIVDASAIIDASAPYPTWIRRHPRAATEWDWSRNNTSRDPWTASGSFPSRVVGVRRRSFLAGKPTGTRRSRVRLPLLQGAIGVARTDRSRQPPAPTGRRMGSCPGCQRGRSRPPQRAVRSPGRLDLPSGSPLASFSRQPRERRARLPVLLRATRRPRRRRPLHPSPGSRRRVGRQAER